MNNKPIEVAIIELNKALVDTLNSCKLPPIIIQQTLRLILADVNKIVEDTNNKIMAEYLKNQISAEANKGVDKEVDTNG